MAEAYQYTCSACAYQIRSENQDEVVESVREHAQGSHDMSMSREEVEGGVQEVQA